MKILKKNRMENGFSQEFVARQMEVSRSTIDNWEKGVTCPSLPMAVKLADVLGIPLDTLAEEFPPDGGRTATGRNHPGGITGMVVG